MANRQKTDYFDRLKIQSEYSLKASRLLKSFLRAYSVSDIFEVLKEMKELTELSDKESKNLLSALENEFLPPIDREDIFLLSKGILRVTDSFDDAFKCIYMYTPAVITRNTVLLSAVCEEACTALHQAVCELKNRKNRDRLKEALSVCEKSEAEFDDAYTKAVRELFSGTNDMRKLLSFTNIYDSIRKCCDTCKDTALLLETVVVKNV